MYMRHKVYMRHLPAPGFGKELGILNIKLLLTFDVAVKRFLRLFVVLVTHEWNSLSSNAEPFIYKEIKVQSMTFLGSGRMDWNVILERGLHFDRQ